MFKTFIVPIAPTSDSLHRCLHMRTLREHYKEAKCL
jgi:hypothetical protein